MPGLAGCRRCPVRRRQAMKRWLRYLNAMAHEEDQVFRRSDVCQSHSPEHIIRREKDPQSPTQYHRTQLCRSKPSASSVFVLRFEFLSVPAICFGLVSMSPSKTTIKSAVLAHDTLFPRHHSPLVRTRVSPSSAEGGPRPYCRSAQPLLKTGGVQYSYRHGRSLAVL